MCVAGFTTGFKTNVKGLRAFHILPLVNLAFLIQAWVDVYVCVFVHARLCVRESHFRIGYSKVPVCVPDVIPVLFCN